MLDISWKNLWNHKARTVLTIMALAMCIQMAVMLIAIISFKENQVSQELSLSAGRVFLQPLSVLPGQQETFPNVKGTMNGEIESQVRELNYVDKLRSLSVMFVELVPAQFPNEPPAVLLAGITPKKERIYIGEESHSSLRQSGSIGFSYSSEQAVVLGAEAAGHYSKQLGRPFSVGQKIEIHNKKFKVKGLLRKTGVLFVDRSVLMPLGTAQNLYDWGNSISALIITGKLDGNGKITDISSRLAQDLPRLSVSDTKRRIRDYNLALSEMRKFFQLMINGILVTAAILVILVMNRAVNERKVDIGVMRAIGATRQAIAAMIVQESAFYVALGGVVGMGMSVLVISLSPMGQQGSVAALFSAGLVWRVFLLLVALGLAAGLLPAWRASSLSPLACIDGK